LLNQVCTCFANLTDKTVLPMPPMPKMPIKRKRQLSCRIH
jgi:hypothetical protein